MWIKVLEIAALLVGVALVLISSIGVYRLPDFYLRIHAPTKAATLGLICILIAMAMAVHERAVVTKAILAVLFIGTTAPAGAHLLARAAYRNAVPSVGDPRVDEYRPVLERRLARRNAAGLEEEEPA